MLSDVRCSFCERRIDAPRQAIEVRLSWVPDVVHWLHRMCTVPFLTQNPLMPSRS